MSEHELLPLYVLDTLPEDERVAFEAHLGACSECRRELASYEPSLFHMAAAVDRQPPPSLGSNVLARIRETPQERPLESTGVAEPVSPRRRASRPSGWLAAAAAVLAFALVAVSAAGVALWQRTGELEQQMAEAEKMSEMATVLAAEDAQMIELESELSGSLRVAVARSLDAGVVLGDDVEAPPDDRVYQLWVLEDGRPRDAGMISDRSGMLGMLVDVEGAEGVAISVEPPSGSDAPTGPIVAQAELGGSRT